MVDRRGTSAPAGAAVVFRGRRTTARLEGDDLVLVGRLETMRIPLSSMDTVARDGGSVVVRLRDSTQFRLPSNNELAADAFVMSCLSRIAAERRLPGGGPPRQVTVTPNAPGNRGMRDWNRPVLGGIAGYAAVLAGLTVWLGLPALLNGVLGTALAAWAVVLCRASAEHMRKHRVLRRHGVTVPAQLIRRERRAPTAGGRAAHMPVYRFTLADGRVWEARSYTEDQTWRRPGVPLEATYDPGDPDLVTGRPPRAFGGAGLAGLLFGAAMLAMYVFLWVWIILDNA